MKDEDFDWIDDQSRAFLQEPFEKSGLLLKIIIAIVITFFIWAYFANIDERTSAEGQVIPSSQVQDIQNLEGGILKEIFVKEGDIVEKGQELLRLDDTRFASQYKENLVKYYALLATFTRLRAESNGEEEIEFSEALKVNYPAFARNAKRLFEANRATYQANVDTLKKNYEILQEQLALTAPLAAEGVVSKIELLKIQKEANEAKGRIAVEEREYTSRVQDELVKVRSEIDSLDGTLDGLKDRMERTEIFSPVQGIVKEINVDTIGGVLQPGEKIMEIVPINDKLWIEAKVPPRKIAFIRKGQNVDIKVTAYDSSIYGSIKGIVKYISADVLIEQDKMKQEDNYYKIIVETDQNYLEFGGEKLPIIPGMQVSADILTGKKTVLEYILKPIIKAKQNALRER